MNIKQKYFTLDTDSASVLLALPGNFYWKNKKGVYMGCTSSMLGLLDLSSIAELTGKTDYDFFPKKQADVLKKTDEAIIKSRESKIVGEVALLRNGKQRIFSIEKVPLKNQENEIIGIAGIFFDISHFKIEESAEKKHKAILSYLEHIVECTPGSIYWKNKEGMYLGCNNYMVRSAGLTSRTDIIGKTDYDLWPEQAKALRENDKEVMKSGQAVSIEETVILPNGNRKYFAVEKMPLRDENGSIVGMIGNSLEITKQKEIEAALQDALNQVKMANHAKTEFLHTVSHEIRNPIYTLSHVFEVIQHKLDELDNIDDDLKKLISISEDELHSILIMLESLTQYMEFDKTKIEHRIQPINVAGIIELAIDKCLSKKMEEVTYAVHIDRTVPDNVGIDVINMTKILVTIIGNAFRFTTEGHIDILVYAFTDERHTPWLEIAVRDTGTGIFPNQIEDIMGYYDAELTEINRYKKPSVKLPYARLLITQVLEGEFEIHSEVDVGTAVIIRVPYQVITAKRRQSKKWKKDRDEIPLLDMSTIRSHDILLVEDYPPNAALTKSMLDKLKQCVDIAETGQEAIQKTQQKPYYLVLMDITLPDMNGIEASQQIWQTNPQQCIAALTSHATEEDQKRFYDAGMAIVLPKPIAFDALARFLKAFQDAKDEEEEE